LQPNEAFIMGGKPVRVKYTFQNTAVVEPAKGESVKTPRWMGNKMSLTAQLAEEELKLRNDLRAAWEARGETGCIEMLRKHYKADSNVAGRISRFVSRQCAATPLPSDSPLIVERVLVARTLMLLVHVVAGRAVNRSLAWVAGARLAHGGSVVANFDDHSFLLSMDARTPVDSALLRAAFNPVNWLEDLRQTVSTTETLGRSFRHIAEIGQLLPRRTLHGNVSAKSSSWSGTLLYKTLLEHEPDHPLLREAVREVMEDQCDAPRAFEETARIHETPIEIYDLPRPSPLGLPLFAAFNREVLLATDPERALDDLIATLYDDWRA
jgi:ATP-dependent Lhr-like helicase